MLFGIFDLETTGLVPGYHEVIDACALLVDVGRADLPITIVREGGGRVLPEHPERIDPIAQSVNGFNEEEWKKTARPILDVAREIWNVLNVVPAFEPPHSVRIIGSNPPFDRDFWKVTPHGWDIPLRHSIDLAALAHPFELAGIVDNVKLDTLCQAFGIEPRGGLRAHSARADCYRAFDVYMYLIRHLGVIAR